MTEHVVPLPDAAGVCTEGLVRFERHDTLRTTAPVILCVDSFDLWDRSVVIRWISP